MKKSRVQLWGKPNGYVVVDIDATEGAVLGQNLRWPNGELVQASDFAGSGDGGGIDGAAYWRSLQEVPDNVQAVEHLSGDGFVRRRGTLWSASPIANADLADASTTGLKEGTNLYFTEQRARDAAPIQAVVGGVGVQIDLADPRRPVVSARISTDTHNRLRRGSDDGLYVPDDLTPDPLAYYILAKT
ncbi:hypothetical protein CO615_03995 [Lysobacteraceae bacterium NML75-0749]|nr:hypothetical protein CO615_03995 [Xanthomonadaceae bacterium NML75-0749]